MGIKIQIHLTGLLGGSLILCGQAAGKDDTSAFRSDISMWFNLCSRLRPKESLHTPSFWTFPCSRLWVITECHPSEPYSSLSSGSARSHSAILSIASYITRNTSASWAAHGGRREVSGIALAPMPPLTLHDVTPGPL